MKVNNSNAKTNRAAISPRAMLFAGMVSATAIMAYAYDCNVLVENACVSINTPCLIGTVSGSVAEAQQMGMCDQGSPGRKQCISDTNHMVNCGYKCLYFEGGIEHSRWQTNSIGLPTLKGDSCP